MPIAVVAGVLERRKPYVKPTVTDVPPSDPGLERFDLSPVEPIEKSGHCDGCAESPAAE